MLFFFFFFFLLLLLFCSCVEIPSMLYTCTRLYLLSQCMNFVLIFVLFSFMVLRRFLYTLQSQNSLLTLTLFFQENVCPLTCLYNEFCLHFWEFSIWIYLDHFNTDFTFVNSFFICVGLCLQPTAVTEEIAR